MTDEEKKARQRAYCYKWRKENRERVIAGRRAWYEKNRDRILAERRTEKKEKTAANGESGSVNQVIGSYANGRYSRCGFSASNDGNRKIAARRKEVLARMAKIKPGWRK